MNSVLERIVSTVLSDEEKKPPLRPIQRGAPLDVPGLMDSGFFLIAEIKHSSPSRGLISQKFDPPALATAYERGGASAISVVTEREHFGGDPEYLRTVRERVGLPLLRKDFILTKRQIVESYNLGADMILLIAACLDKENLRMLYSTTMELGMTPLLEIHNHTELQMAIEVEPLLIGINNRNLHDFSVNIDTSLSLAGEIPRRIRKISESGIKTSSDIRLLKEAGFEGALVGESLLVSQDPESAVRGLLNG
jgi:indole-3-glycerol phosphate synthase